MQKKLIYENRFKRDLRKCKKQGKDISLLTEIVDLLLESKTLPPKNRNHKLQGLYDDNWECHIEPDWLLIYEKSATEILLLRTGSHSDLF